MSSMIFSMICMSFSVSSRAYFVHDEYAIKKIKAFVKQCIAFIFSPQTHHSRQKFSLVKNLFPGYAV